MKLNRFLALAAIALLVVAAMGTIAARSFAQSPAAHPRQAQATEASDSREPVSGPDSDNVDEQIGDQNAPDAGAEVNGGAQVDEQVGDQTSADTDAEVNGGAQVDEQVGDQTSADTGAEVNGGAQTESGGGQDAAPSGTPAITAAAAQKTAEAYLNAGAATKVELDDENGKLVYGVEINGTDVKVDAMTGAVLGVETGRD